MFQNNFFQKSFGQKFSEPNQTSNMKRIVKVVNGFLLQTIFVKCSVLDDGQISKHTSAMMMQKPRGGSRTAATSKMEPFVIIVNGWRPLTIITKISILDVAAVLDPPLKPI